MKAKGILVVFDGIDGCGKSTQVNLLDKRLKAAGIPSVVAREPTEGQWGRKLRESALHGRLSPKEELEVILNDRREDVTRNIQPALDARAIVILDRYYTSTITYQGLRGLDPVEIRQKNEEFAPTPDLTFLFSLDADLAHRRIRNRGDNPDAFEDIQELVEVAKRFDQLDLPGIVRLDAQLAKDQLCSIIYRLVIQRYLFGISPPPKMVSVPTIDLMGGRAAELNSLSVGQQVSEACETAGFFRIANHGIPSKQLKDTRDLAQTFFSLHEKSKLQAHRDGRGRGFLPIAAERLGATVGDYGPGDLKETFNAGPQDGTNIWPAELPQFRPQMRAIFAALSNLSHVLLELFAHALCLPPSSFQSFTTNAKSILRLSHYPRLDAPMEDGQMRATPHTDYGSLTILNPDSEVGGLQIYLPNQHWIEIDCPPDELVINVGDLMERWTNGRWASTIHQVAAKQGESDRLSVAFLHNPNQSAAIAPFQKYLGSDGESAYPEVVARDYLKKRSEVSRQHLKS